MQSVICEPDAIAIMNDIQVDGRHIAMRPLTLCVYVYVYVHMHVYVCICVCVYACVCVCVCVLLKGSKALFSFLYGPAMRPMASME